MIVQGLQRRAGDLHILFVIHREVTSIAIASAQRRHSQNIGNELELAPVPGPDHGAGAGQSLRFLIDMRLIRRLLHFILDQPVRPSDADDVDGSMVSRIECQRHSVVELAAVQSSSLHLDRRILSQLETSHALELNTDPVTLLALIA